MDNEKRERALDAGRILASPVFCGVFARLDGKFVAQWRAARTPEERERAWMMQSALAAVQKALFGELQNAALDAGGKDAELNAAVKAAKEKKRG